MKYTIYILMCTAISCLIYTDMSGQSETRKTLWLGGISTTSRGFVVNNWNLNWDFEDLITTDANFNAGYDPGRGVFEASEYLAPLLEDQENVLGIAHDLGGLILRDLANNNSNVTAMILDGVPNQGSSAIGLAAGQRLPPNGGATAIQDIIDKVKTIQGGADCEDCGVIEAFEQFIDEIARNEDLFKQMASNSDEVNHLNKEENLPSIPYAILWGSVSDEDSRNIASLMDAGTWINPFSTHLEDCAADELARREGEIKDEITRNAIDNAIGFFSDVVGFAQNLLTGGIFGDPDDPNSNFDKLGFIGSITDFIDNAKDGILDWIKDNQETDSKLADLMRCQMANQLLATEWELAMMQTGSFETTRVRAEPNIHLCQEHCWQILGPSPSHTEFGACIHRCMQSQPDEFITVYTGELHDLILTKGEQQLAGADFTYHLFNHNHMQESRDKPGNNSKDLNDAFSDLFGGNAGAAFIIPEK